MALPTLPEDLEDLSENENEKTPLSKSPSSSKSRRQKQEQRSPELMHPALRQPPSSSERSHRAHSASSPRSQSRASPEPRQIPLPRPARASTEPQYLPVSHPALVTRTSTERTHSLPPSNPATSAAISRASTVPPAAAPPIARKNSPSAYNKRIPSSKKTPGLRERWLTARHDVPEHYEALQDSEAIWSKLHLDPLTADPLAPMHAGIPYALAWYHLDWIRTPRPDASVRGRDETAMDRAAALACEGVVVHRGRCGTERPDVRYCIEPSYFEGAVLLDAAVRFTFALRGHHPVLRREWACYYAPLSRRWRFQVCPHARHRFTAYELVGRRGLVAASVWHEARTPSAFRLGWRWRSIYGTRRYAYGCSRCRMDSEVKLEMVDDVVVVTINVYRDLGSGESPTEGEWLSALRRSCSLSTERTEEDLRKQTVKQRCRRATDAKKAAVLHR
ncbi:hypothetical protein F5Y15DRAFT_428832 [Xylariaceae sp. FL0016]|nr:hypothetical protein F5Y15DRAFT_428832 [Xylariaceae sp. FL0016]